MIKEITYSSYSAVPSDYECPDGSLATAIGAILEDGALHPVMQPTPVYETFDNVNGYGKVLFVHQTSGPQLYIVLRGSTLFAEASKPQSRSALHSFQGEDIRQVTSVGNTLIVLTDKAMHHLLWKASSANPAGTYLYLGTHLPECPLSFGLQGEMVRTDEFTVTFAEPVAEANIFNELSDKNKSRITEQVLAKVNKFIAEESIQKGRFLYPFLVRYAYRLFDGSLTMHSSPVLMIASSDLAPQVYYTHISGGKSYDRATLRVFGVFHHLDYAVTSESHLQELSRWKDIVRSVDIFITPPIYTYDQNGQCSAFTRTENHDSYCVCLHTNGKLNPAWYPLRYQKDTYNTLYSVTFSPGSYIPSRLAIPRRSPDQVKEEITSASKFFLLESIPLDQLSAARVKINVEENYLQSLLAREPMTDDFDSHDRLIPLYAHPYNSRLNLANLSKELYADFAAGAMVPFTNGFVDKNASIDNALHSDKTNRFNVYFFIRQDGRDIVVTGHYAEMSYNAPILYLFYPNANAYKAVVTVYDGLFHHYEYPLQPHPLLNGASCFIGWEGIPAGTSSPQLSTPQERIVSLPNKIYTSEVGNPFRFPVLGINTVGTGTVLGISSAAKALSEGQFGQFPLYAFTTEGVWALEVSPTGTYSARQPVTRDVCISPQSITQIDSAVLFATARGIMLLSGSTAQCISEAVNSETPFHLPSLPSSDALLDIFHSRASFSNTSHTNFVLQPFSLFLSGSRMIYDYIHQRIIVYNPSFRYAYVYSLKSQAWGMMYSDISSSVPSYPEALAMDSLHRLVDFSLTRSGQETAFIITRPFKIDSPDVFKTINTVIQRGLFRPGNVAQALFGSNDLLHWHPVWTAADKYLRGFHGTPYKSFRLALIITLGPGESLTGCSLQFSPRKLNRLR